MRKKLKQIFSAALAGIVMCTAITFYPVEAKAAAKAATKDVWNGVSSADWMSYLDDSLKISEINLPGTHDSATKNVGGVSSAQCQDTSITEQLNRGIRFLDLRLKKSDSGLKLVHGELVTCYESGYTTLMLDKVLQNCYDFLDAHPSETIVVSMKKDAGSEKDSEIETLIHNYIKDHPEYWYLDNTSPALGDVRGKIVLMRRYYHAQGDDSHEFENGYGVRIFWSDQGGSTVAASPWAGPINVTRYGWVQYCVQDRYEYKNGDKWTAIQQGLDSPPHTTNAKVGDINITPATTYFLNFMSTAGENNPKSSAKTINANFLNYNNGSLEYGRSYGWIIMDFATEELAKHVYQSNKSPKLEVASTIKELESVIPATVEADFALPSAGESGASITWSCNPASALRTIGDKLTLVCQPSGDVNITLTATVSSGNYSQQKEFQVLVKKLPEKFVELKTTLGEAEAILADPANAKYDLDSLETAVETARALMRQDADKVSETQIKAARETLNTIKDRELVLKNVKKLRENLIAWYPLTDNSKDVSGNHNNGAATGVTYSKDSGATFKDSGKKQSYISLPTQMFDGKERMTISFWAKDTKSSGSNTVFGFGSGTEPDGDNSANVYRYVLINTNHTNRSLKAVITKNTWRDERGFKLEECSFPANEWAHITCVFDGTKFALYKNGTLIENKDIGIKLTDLGTNTVAYIGNSIWTNNDVDYNGSVKDFRVYDCAIAPEQIEKIYNDKDMDISADSGHLIARYPLTADSRNVAGKGKDGVATGVTFSPENGATFKDSGKKQSYISLPTAMFDGEEQMTFSFWAKDTKSNTDSNTVFGIGSGTEPDDEKSANIFKYVLINTNNDRNLKAVITKTSWHKEEGFFKECSFPANEWAHITCVFDGSKFTLYKNGDLIGNKDTGIKLTDIGKNTVAYIGNSIWTHNDVDYSGSVKDFRIYDCALSEAEAKGLMDESIKDEVMESLISALDLDITKGEDGSLSMSIIDAITLPTAVSGGTISWSSDKADVIDNTGKVTLPTDKGIEDVTLTAMVTINGKETKITFHCEVFAEHISTADLQAVILSAETIMSGLNEADYTASSWNAFQQALNAAKQQLSRPTSQEDIDAVQAALQAKKNALVKLGDKTALNALIKTVKSLNEKDYITETWTEFEAALTAAEEAAKSNDVSQDDVDTAKNNLSAKKEALVKRGDKTSLKAAIKAAEEDLSEEDYTQETWAELLKTLDEVKETNENIDATEGEVKDAEQSLDAAVKALKKITYTVTFNFNNGSDDIPVTVERKDKVSAPAEEPEKDGYIFDGWFEADAEEAFDFANTSVMSNITLTAKWVAKRIVTFKPDNNKADWTVEVKDGGKVTKPDTPEKEGYEFEYWYVEGEDTEFDFANTTITANITLKAKWIKLHTVTFNPDNGSTASPVIVKDGEKVTKPDTPEKEGYEFEYWYAEGEESGFDFANTSITANITLKAKWKEKETSGNVTTLKPTVTQGGTGSININVNAGSIEPGKKTEVAIAIPDSIAENIKNCEGTEVSINVNIPDGMKNNENIDLTAITLPKEALEAARDEDKDLIITVNGDSSYQWVFTAEELKSAAITDVNLLVEKDGAKADEVKNKLNDNEEGTVFSFVQAVSGSVSVDVEGMNWKAGDAVNLSYYNSETKRLESVSGTYQVGANGKVTIKVPKAGSYVLWRKTAANEEPTIIKVKTLKINAKKLTLGGGEKFTLKVTITPKDATNKKVTFTSSNKKAATVNTKGVVTAKKVKKPAKTTITAKVDGKSIKCTVNVKPAPKKIALNAKSKTLKKGKTFQIKVKYTPKNAASYKLKYSIDKKGKKVVTVDSKGKIKAKKKGKATVTVTAFNKKKATIKITVK